MRVVQALLCATPLLSLGVWAYLDARAYRYKTASELLSGDYLGVAERLPTAGLVLGFLPLIGFAAFLFVTLTGRSRSVSSAAVAGALTGLLLVYPGFAPSILGGSWTLVSIGTLLLGSLLMVAVHGVLDRFEACAVPSAGLLLLLGVDWSTTTASRVALHSNPPLAVLAAFAESPKNVDNRLRMGLHLWSLGGDAEARPYLLSAAVDLEARYTADNDTALANAARLLAARASTLPLQRAPKEQLSRAQTEEDN